MISSGPGNSETVFRKICDGNCGKHDDASDDLSDRHHLSKQKHAGNQCENGLETEDHGCDGRLSFLLPQHLQGVCDAAGHDPRIENREP